MFTGLVEELATVLRVDVRPAGAHFDLQASHIMSDMHVGDSIAVNGVCLTVVRFDARMFTVDAVPETMRSTNLHRLHPGSRVHVERALAAGGRFGGHIVSGHVDGVGIIKRRVQEGLAAVLTIETSDDVLRYVVRKGSICINGVSLTVVDVQGRTFTVSLIPHTGEVTLLREASVGTEVNLECDVIAKYVERLLQGPMAAPGPQAARASGVSQEARYVWLKQNGFA